MEAAPPARSHGLARFVLVGAALGLLLVGSQPGWPLHLRGSSLLVAVSLPLLVLASLPRRTPWAGFEGELLDLACALPLLGLAARSDARDHGWVAVVATGGLALGLGLLWGVAARRAALNARTRGLHAALWFLGVPLVTGLEFVLAFAGRGGEAQGASVLGASAWASPLVALHACGAGGGLAAPRPGLFLLALATGLLLVLIVEGLRRYEGAS